MDMEVQIFYGVVFHCQALPYLLILILLVFTFLVNNILFIALRGHHQWKPCLKKARHRGKCHLFWCKANKRSQENGVTRIP